MERLSHRVAAVAESVTLAIDAKAKALKASGVPVISFGAGEPDFPTPDYIVEAAVAACRDPQNHRYSPASGLPELRHAIADKTMRDTGYAINAAQVLVTNGAKQAVEHAFMSLIDDGDEVLLPAPYWITYPVLVRLAGGRPVDIHTDESSGFKVSVDQLEAARTPRTKALLFCSPSNPTGVVYCRDEIAAIGRWAVEHGIWVITDEIYEHLVFGGAEHVSMPAVVPELANQCIVINGVAKTYAMTGWRVGWLIGPADIVTAAGNRHSHVTSNVANVSQRAALAAVRGDLSAVAEMRVAFDRRRIAMVQFVNDITGFSCIEPQGAFYVLANVKDALGKSVRGRTPRSSLELADLLLDEIKVAVIPGEGFAAAGYVRLSYAMSDADLAEGLERVAKLFSE